MQPKFRFPSEAEALEAGFFREGNLVVVLGKVEVGFVDKGRTFISYA